MNNSEFNRATYRFSREKSEAYAKGRGIAPQVLAALAASFADMDGQPAIVDDYRRDLWGILAFLVLGRSGRVYSVFPEEVEEAKTGAPATLGEVISYYMALNRLSVSALAKKMETTTRTLKKKLDAPGNFTYRDLMKFSEATGASLLTLLECKLPPKPRNAGARKQAKEE